ncbi:MAG: phosphorylase [Bacteroidetes bacterium MED-G21]|nr:MAG: phosphorylase [Bacteroidetes bacterium MED-G21]
MDKLICSELILNNDGSVYHLKLHPEDIADTIIVVGDPNRVPLISKHFDNISVTKSNREFITHTGYIGKKHISVMSTGIGVDNIDIVFNELDILSAIDLKSRTLKKTKRTFKIIRLGTTGGLNDKINVDDILFSRYAIGIDGVPHHYQYDLNLFEQKLSDEFAKKTNWSKKLADPYAVKSSNFLWNHMYEDQFNKGITLTMNGFYAPQGRSLRIPLSQPDIIKKSDSILFNNLRVSNIEMETAGLYAFGKMFNHEVISLSTVLANRSTGVFSSNPSKSIEKLINFALSKIESL